MKKILLIISLFLFLSTNIFSENSKQVSNLTNGKWVNKSDGYIPNPTGNSDRNVKRNKTKSRNLGK